MVPYEMPPRRGLHAIGGQVNCFAIDFPSRCWIEKIIVEQVNGDLADFTLTLYNRADVCDGDSLSDAVGPDEGLGSLPSSMFKVGRTLSGEGGYLEHFADDSNGGRGFLFFNQDNREDAVPRPKHVNKIYVQITPDGIGAKEYAIVMAGEIYD